MTNRGLTVHNRNVLQQVEMSSEEEPRCNEAQSMFQFHFLKDNYYYPFRITHWSDSDKTRLSLFFVSFRDKSQYQAADRSGTFIGKPATDCLVYDEQFSHRYHVRQVQVGANWQTLIPWTEQFDSISKDFISTLSEDESLLDLFKAKCINKLQKWWCLSGKYWPVKNLYNDDNSKLMKWLMNGANHSTIDTCGENVSFARGLVFSKDGCRKGHLLESGGMDNHSKILKLDLR